ncbi:hypothetical protein BDF22DRAFT_691715 [Syncephalis plumigaleata]|nr:hypothetical protein BDF22DRAFT_691715 [Syncephalis plumigaleata]
MIFPQQFQAFAAICMAGLMTIATQSDAISIAAPQRIAHSLFKTGYTLNELPRIRLKSTPFGKDMPVITETFKLDNTVYYGKGVAGNKHYQILCGNDVSNNPKDRSFQILHDIERTRLPAAHNMGKHTILRSASFKQLNDGGVCYFCATLANYIKGMMYRKLDEESEKRRNMLFNRINDSIKDGLIYLARVGWNICIEGASSIIMRGYNNAESVRLSNDAQKVNEAEDNANKISAKIEETKQKASRSL